MKINEILEEGILDTIKQVGAGIKGLAQTKSLSGARAYRKQAMGMQLTQELVRKAFDDWNIYRGKTGQIDIIPWAKEYFENPNIAIQPGNINNAADVKKFILALVQDYERRQQNDIDNLPTSSAQSPTTSKSSAARAGTVIPNVSVPGFTIINREPIVVRYQKKDYSLNSQGEWQLMTPRGTRAPLIKDSNPTLEKLLDKAAGL